MIPVERALRCDWCEAWAWLPTPHFGENGKRCKGAHRPAVGTQSPAGLHLRSLEETWDPVRFPAIVPNPLPVSDPTPTPTPVYGTQQVLLSAIERYGLQSRAAENEATIQDYSDEMREGVVFPPIVLFFDGDAYHIGDGHHRFRAADRAGLTSILATVEPGSRRDALLYSVGSNRVHGLRRTNADKRQAVEILFEDSEWSLFSDRKIADITGTSNAFVSRLRASWQKPESRSDLPSVEDPTIYTTEIVGSEEVDDPKPTDLSSDTPSVGKPVERAALDAYYTPDQHARACVKWLASTLNLSVSCLVEPSIGGGAWMRAVKAVFPGVFVIGVDLDPGAPGLSMAHAPRVGDFLSIDLMIPPLETISVVVGNPPYTGDIREWVTRGLQCAPVVGFLLRETWTGSMERLPWFTGDCRPTWIVKVLPRPRWEGAGHRESSDSCDSVFVVWDRRVASPSYTCFDWLDVSV